MRGRTRARGEEDRGCEVGVRRGGRGARDPGRGPRGDRRAGWDDAGAPNRAGRRARVRTPWPRRSAESSRASPEDALAAAGALGRGVRADTEGALEREVGCRGPVCRGVFGAVPRSVLRARVETSRPGPAEGSRAREGARGPLLAFCSPREGDLFCVLAMGANRLWESPGPGTGRVHFLAGPGGHGTPPESLGMRGRGPHDHLGIGGEAGPVLSSCFPGTPPAQKSRVWASTAVPNLRMLPGSEGKAGSSAACRGKGNCQGAARAGR